jgi:putative hydrolase of the HAD superfamily
LSIVAEFARTLHEKYPSVNNNIFTTIEYPSKTSKISDIKVAVFDVYGTLINYWKDEFCKPQEKINSFYNAFEKIITLFNMKDYLLEMNPNEPPQKTLFDLYHGLISLKQELALKKNIEFPEINIEKIWDAIIQMLKRRGYNIKDKQLGEESDFIRCVAYAYNFFALNRGLYPDVADALLGLKKQNILLGIISNAQFYTPIDLSLFLRDQTNNEIDDYLRIFEQDLVFFSYEYGVSKPNILLYRKLFDALYEYNVLPEQTIFIGNDIVSDIYSAQQVGLKTAFFIGDSRCSFTHEKSEIIPDISFSLWKELPDKISFYPDKSFQEGCN